jgi:hypothetical protein
MRYPFGTESLAKLDEYILSRTNAPGFEQSEEINVLDLGIFVYKHFDRYGWFFGVLSRFWHSHGTRFMQVINFLQFLSLSSYAKHHHSQIVYIDKDMEDVLRDGYAGWVVDASAVDLATVRAVCKSNVAQRLMEAQKAAEKEARRTANKATVCKARGVASRAPYRDWNAPAPPAPPNSPPGQQRLFTKTIASPGRLPTESSDVVFQGVRSPHIFVVASDDSDTDGEGMVIPSNNSSSNDRNGRQLIEFQQRGSPHVHNLI